MWWTIHWFILVELSPNLFCQSDFSLIQKFSWFGFWWKYVVNIQSDSARFRFFSDYSWKYVVNNSLIHSCGSKSKYVLLDSEIFWLLLWVFLQNMWWTAHLFTIFLIDSFGVFMKICGEHIHWFIVELSKSKLVLPTWFRNFSDCFLPIWRAFVVVYDLLYQANSQWTIRPIIIKLL